MNNDNYIGNFRELVNTMNDKCGVNANINTLHFRKYLQFIL